MKTWLVTLRRAGGGTYEPVEAMGIDKDHAVEMAKARMCKRWGVDPDTLIVVSAELADPTRPT